MVVGQVRPGHATVGGARARPGNNRPVSIQAEQTDIARGQPLTQAGLSEQYGGLCIVQHKRHALGWKSRVERHESAPGLEDAHQPDNHFERALHADADTQLRSHSPLAQFVRKLIRAGIQFAVGELGNRDWGLGIGGVGCLPVPNPRIDQRDRVGSTVHLGLEELVVALLLGIGSLAGVTCQDQLLPLGGGQERQVGQAKHRVRHHAFQQRPHVP